ncbi:tRNA-intron endonuclease catalytic domain-like protein [Artomyces pyxidatus]|uniref:tRNA-intron endonuclease catalytic domain-like protein n=1 Tax=Artomyces pyxidatus TaxID=48021 RepID=A0ACB8SXM2_9AGAM|nr:tRNA-intron endonuclease catalytic domain-like protein [Artomyces pyxidatus]
MAQGILGISQHRVVNPHCEGILDPPTRSVWVTNSTDAKILWRRGFFGKGNLSRSEPSWLARQINARHAAGKYMTSEEVTAKRRSERRQFKVDRARAIAAAAADAEAAFAEGRIISAEEVKASIPSAATWKSSASVADALPPPPPSREADAVADDLEVEPLEDLEHMQLTLQEAFFLAWALDCLTVLHPKTMEPLTLEELWAQCQSAHHPPYIQLTSPQLSRTDNPFLLNYVFFHHYRSLGWVVKSGLKFCVDYLLYKRGPVFHHAEFAMLLVPSYEDPEDAKTSPYNLPNVGPFTWQWLSTINRVNSQVQKTLVLSYVTIPAQSRLSASNLASPACFGQYSLREVTIRRFVPTRMRD